MRRDHRRLNNRLDELRNRIAEWAAQHHREELEAAVVRVLGPRPRDTGRVHAAVAFALLAPPADGPSLIERWDAATPRPKNRMERTVRAAWRACSYRLLGVMDVKPGKGFTAEDAVTGEVLSVAERQGSEQLVPGDRLLGFVLQVDGEYLMEGAAELLAASAVEPTRAALADAAPTPEGTRRAAWPAIDAMHAAYATD